jgi:HD domain-containing protein
MGQGMSRNGMGTNQSLFGAIERSDPVDIEQHERILAMVRSWLHVAFAQPDVYHGEAHAEDVLRRCLDIADQLRSPLATIERLVLAMAALLHDIGYTAYHSSWAPNRREHVPASIAFAEQHLPQLDLFGRHSELINAVAYLIAYHDDTSYKFPSNVWDGFVGSIDLGPYASQLGAFEVDLPRADLRRLRLLLAILREADAVTAAGIDGAERTYNYAKHRRLRSFAPGNPLNAWCWEESAAGNTRLAAKRALIDALTSKGRKLAVSSYLATEEFLRAACAQEGVSYEPETLGSLLAVSRFRMPTSHSALEVVRYLGWDSLRQILEGETEAGEHVHHRTAATASVRGLPVAELPDVSVPTNDAAHYSALVELHSHLIAEYALSLFDLTGVLEYKWNGVSAWALPPIVERRAGTGGSGESAESLMIVDGAATVALARELAVPRLWVVEVEFAPIVQGESGLAGKFAELFSREVGSS